MRDQFFSRDYYFCSQELTRHFFPPHPHPEVRQRGNCFLLLLFARLHIEMDKKLIYEVHSARVPHQLPMAANRFAPPTNYDRSERRAAKCEV